MTDLDRLDTLASKATPGPWIRPWGAQHLMSPFDLSVVMGDDQATLDYIAAVSPDVVQSLVARVRDAEAALEDLVGVLTEPDAVWDKTWPKRRNDAIAKARAALATAQGGEK